MPTVSAPSRASVNLQLRGAVFSTELTLNMITIVLDRNASNYAPLGKMPLRQKRDATAQTSYWRGAYGILRAALESRIKHNTSESAFVVLKSRKESRVVPCS